MASQQPAPAASAVNHRELLATDPRVEGFFISPTRDHNDFVRTFGAQDLHIDEARKLLHEPPAVGEPLDDLIGHALFHR
jgi:hypothetical protein